MWVRQSPAGASLSSAGAPLPPLTAPAQLGLHSHRACKPVRPDLAWIGPEPCLDQRGAEQSLQLHGSARQNCLFNRHFLSLSGWENVVFLAQTLHQPIQLHPNYLCGNRMLCQKCYSVYLSILPNSRHLYNQETQYFLQHMKATVQE